MMSKKNYILLNEVWKDYLKTRNNDRYNQQQKNQKYALLMALTGSTISNSFVSRRRI